MLMVRDPRRLDQNPVVIDPANVDAVLDDRTTAVSDPLAPPLDEVDNDNHPVDGKPAARSAGRLEPKTRRTVDGTPEGTPLKPDDPRR
jgi:hypothetical protein